MHELTLLQTLQLDNNNISTVPDSLAALSVLEELLLEGNNLKTVPAFLRRATMPALNYLVLENNPLEYIPDEILQDQVRSAKRLCGSLLKFDFLLLSRCYILYIRWKPWSKSTQGYSKAAKAMVRSSTGSSVRLLIPRARDELATSKDKRSHSYHWPQ